MPLFFFALSIAKRAGLIDIAPTPFGYAAISVFVSGFAFFIARNYDRPVREFFIRKSASRKTQALGEDLRVSSLETREADQ
jgi:hypothetical protein